MTGQTPDWFGRSLPRRSGQFIPAPVEPVVYRTFDPEFLESVRDRLVSLSWDGPATEPAPETTQAVRRYLDGE